MSESNHTILDSWPQLKDDLGTFLSDTDAWVISQLRNAYEKKDWDAVGKLLEIMDFVHNLSHSH
ncbi:MAG: hypothetical protein JSU79_05235 [Dehalococcoidales bacterium]|nr:MAG: hypothetical protein JSU79_05235 [Dehalococcoidales bacterium]